jgi:hypothetical protein
VPSATKTLLRPATTRSEEGDFAPTEDAWDAVCAYLSMLDKKLPELQIVILCYGSPPDSKEVLVTTLTNDVEEDACASWHKHNAHHICLTLLTDSVQQMLKLHHMMDSQFLRYQTVIGTAWDEGNWILSSQFAKAVFAGTWPARLIGADDFGERGQTHCASYILAALQTHRVLQGYI